MVYAVRANKVFTTRKPVEMKRIESPQAKNMREFYEKHSFSVNITPSGEISVEIKDREVCE